MSLQRPEQVRLPVVRLRSSGVGALAVIFLAVGAAGPVAAESLLQAMANAYGANPSLNAARAETRAVDENVPQALSGYRPSVAASADYGFTSSDSVSRPSAATGGRSIRSSSRTEPAGVGLSVSQPIFNGFRTRNAVKSAESQVRSSREGLRNTEQNTLLDAVAAYMDVLRDGAIADLRRSNVEFLEEQVRASRDRFNVGEGTRTDVAQAEARLSQATTQVLVAESNYTSSRAVYRQVIGNDPAKLAPGRVPEKLLPSTLNAALAASQEEHPAILAAVHGVDAATHQVKSVEGEMLPSVSVQADVARRWDPSASVERSDSASIVGRVTIPIYQAGQVSSRVRQAKETLGQRRIEVDVARDQVRAAVVAAWGGLEAARSQITAANAQVSAAQLALEGVIEEQKVGQRTTLDVLDAQQELLDAKVTLVSAERDKVVAAYSLIAAVGRLTAERLGLQVAVYRPETHYDQVRDRWFGLRTPDGR
ncbi:MAG: TolC family outer membrane protein [Hyphomicrobiales bacterium]|nr:TolC family outer membrane protein [Hyphomicrobiales bacterium]